MNIPVLNIPATSVPTPMSFNFNEGKQNGKLRSFFGNLLSATGAFFVNGLNQGVQQSQASNPLSNQSTLIVAGLALLLILKK